VEEIGETSMPPKSRRWEVLLIGGASGVGKTSISYRLAHYFGIGITEVDVFQVILEHMTTPEQQPILHYWNTNPEAAKLSPEKIVELTISVGKVMLPVLEVVIANHIESQRPIVLEGDYILPALGAQARYGEYANQGRIRAIFIDEADEAQIVQNYLLREPDEGEQTFRAHVSWLYADWLRREAEKFGIAVVPSRPWDTLFERLVAVLT
jgi:2-phosphoglycerate kinase